MMSNVHRFGFNVVLHTPAVCRKTRRAYWKKFTLVFDRNELGIAELMTEKSRRVQSGKLLEVVDEMSLIVVAATTGDVCPLDALACGDSN